MVESGIEFLRKLQQALGIQGGVRRIVIDAAVDSAVKVHVERFLPTDQADDVAKVMADAPIIVKDVSKVDVGPVITFSVPPVLALRADLWRPCRIQQSEETEQEEGDELFRQMFRQHGPVGTSFKVKITDETFGCRSSDDDLVLCVREKPFTPRRLEGQIVSGWPKPEFEFLPGTIFTVAGSHLKARFVIIDSRGLIESDGPFRIGEAD